MKKFNVEITGFSHGEVSDYCSYFNKNIIYMETAKQISNLIVTTYGAITRRPGSELLNIFTISNMSRRLISFQYKADVFVIDIAPGTLYFYKNNVPLLINGSHYTINHSWQTEAVKNLCWVVDDVNNMIYFFEKNTEPKVIKLVDNHVFILENFNIEDGPYDKINTQDISLSFERITIGGVNQIKITATTTYFSSKDSGKLLRVFHDNYWGVLKLDHINGDTAIVYSVEVKPLKSLGATKYFRKSLWCKSLGYPSLACIFNGRLYCAKTLDNSTSIWVSNLWQYNNFAPTTTVDNTDIISEENAISTSISEGKSIMWLNSSKDSLLIGSQEGIFSLSALNVDEAISPLNCNINKISSQNTSSVVYSDGDKTFYSNYHKNHLYCVYIVENKILQEEHINLQALHLFVSPIKNIVCVKYPFNMLWVILENGDLLCGTLMQENNATKVAWSSHKLGGNNKIDDIATGYKLQQEFLYLGLDRQINEVNYQCLEMISFRDFGHLYKYGNIDKNYYLDCYQKHQLNRQTIDDLTTFNNENISIVSADNSIYFGKMLVKDNQVELMNPYNNQDVIVGYNFDSTYASQHLENLILDSSTYGLNKKIENIYIGTINSGNLNIVDNNNSYRMQDIFNMSLVNSTNNSHIQSVSVDFPWHISPNITLQQDIPKSMNVLFIKAIITTN